MTVNVFGRLYAQDERDAGFPMQLEAAEEIETMLWGAPRAMNQGSNPWCVAYAWVGALAAFPKPRPRGTPEHSALPAFGDLYCAAQARDEWEGDCTNRRYDGTSVRAGAKVLTDLGLVAEYRWATSAEDVLRYLANRGPVVLGTRWTQSMSTPDSEGIVRVTGRSIGGHATTAVGYDAERDLVDCLNSWGWSWGPRGGRFWLPTDGLSLLIDEGDGEACSPVEVEG